MMCSEIVLDNGLVIKGVTLLTIEEAEELTEEKLNINCDWWLRSPGYGSNRAVLVRSDGSISYDGGDVRDGNVTVRPALEISNVKSSDFEIGDMFKFGQNVFEVISDTKALCKEVIGECAFQENWILDMNAYNMSTVKEYIDNWYQDTIYQLPETVRKMIHLENGIGVIEATLLSKEEAKKLSKETLAIGKSWWLCSPGNLHYGNCAAFVYQDGTVCADGNGRHIPLAAIRPALVIDFKSSDYKIGEVFKFGNMDFEIVSDTHALCTDSIGECAFENEQGAGDVINYETSDVKKLVDNWYTEHTKTFAAQSSPVSESSKTFADNKIKAEKSMLDIASMMANNNVKLFE